MNIWNFSNRILETWTGHKWHFIISCLDPQNASGPDDVNHHMCEVEYPVRKPDWCLCLYLCPLIWLKTYLKTVLSKILLTQLRSDIGLLFEVIDLSDFLKTAVTLASFQNDRTHFFLRDKLNSLQCRRQIVLFHFTSTSWNILLYYDCIWKSDSFDIDVFRCKQCIWSCLEYRFIYKPINSQFQKLKQFIGRYTI
jgi:hypothetical protein